MPANEAVRKRLLTWYRRHGRDLPWRRSRDPYHIWISEVMLQQTQVETVIPYYHRFLNAFPDVAALAAAPQSAVLKHWEGLGYYARARNLHKAAQQVVQEHGSQLPRTPEDLRRLPGIGRYTAAAVASIAFGQDTVALDGNLHRVLCRLFAIDDDPGRPNTQRTLEYLALSMLPAGQAGDFNQALMDLGATLCRRSRPACDDCPVAADCVARREGRQAELPAPRPRREARPSGNAPRPAWPRRPGCAPRRP